MWANIIEKQKVQTKKGIEAKIERLGGWEKGEEVVIDIELQYNCLWSVPKNENNKSMEFEFLCMPINWEMKSMRWN